MKGKDLFQEEKYRITTSVGKVTDLKNAVKNWKQYPGDFTMACQAAVHYAKKFKQKMLIIPGNSNMQAVFHIIRDDEDIKKVTVMKPSGMSIAVADPKGNVFNAKVV